MSNAGRKKHCWYLGIRPEQVDFLVMKKMAIIRVGRATIIAVGSTENILNNKEIFETKDLTEIASKRFDL